MTAAGKRGVILIVRQPGNARVLAAAAEEAGMAAARAPTADALQALLKQRDGHWVALVDPTGFGQAVWPLCQQLQDCRVPFVVLFASQDRDAGNRSLQYGAASILRKPVAKDALLKLLQSLPPGPGSTREDTHGRGV
ncbi:response regulator receiver protein [Alkalilimnicola ehrlichii MLHE-1]|uniref:Response regulator receiver protein n=1 Tax=Alkalilimnicola ehrlichii (strain ATCC BAA-1101 / DSM 17681 / MLHE-1) TaxID=187272 RepID=Q0AB04_ALKEH|nr:transcriptional regulator [Alkalilimnicola ehrlichii]ABI55983.1 response regulator receiver protein [Alkalilimnicola ehrlichii MLHE-1]